MTIFDKFLKKPEQSVAEIQEGLAEIDEGANACQEAIAAASEKRRSLLIDGSEQDIKALDDNLASEKLQLERCQAAREKLQAKLPEAEEREAEAERERLIAEHDELLAGAFEDIKKYKSHAKPAGAALGRLKSKKARLMVLSSKHNIGSGNPEGAYINQLVGSISVRMPCLLQDVRLPVPAHWSHTYWPPNLPGSETD